jgi:hypothetical protein
MVDIRQVFAASRRLLVGLQIGEGNDWDLKVPKV